MFKYLLISDCALCLIALNLCKNAYGMMTDKAGQRPLLLRKIEQSPVTKNTLKSLSLSTGVPVEVFYRFS